MMKFLFELCAENAEAAQAAQAGGADRIELCSLLSIGGVTPGADLIAETVAALSIPVHILIRPRGGDFVFSADEFVQMCRQIEHAKLAGSAGVAVGILLPNGSVDVERCSNLVKLARPMSVTFHRAFDETTDLRQALEDVIQTGVDCLLTSGGAPDVLTGAESIARLHNQARGRLEIMAGGGLKLANLAEVVRRTGVSYLHGSLSRKAGVCASESQKRTENGTANQEHGNNGHLAVSCQAMLEADVRESLRLLRAEIEARESAAHAAR
ncbi:MAG: copper homeostasis protein CutC [Terracidiphilus sp.]